MNAQTSHILNRTISSLVIGTCLFLVSAADASAHKIEYRPYVVHRQYVYGQTRIFPGWLRKNREFQRWYLHSRYRLMRHMTWHRLYDIYHFEKRYRLQSRRFHGKVYRDHGYRTYYRKPKKHRH